MTFELLSPDPQIPAQLWDLLDRGAGVQHVGTVGDAVQLVAFDHGEHAAVVTAGLSRFPLRDGAPSELVCRVRTDQVGAAEVALRIAVERVAETLEGWQPNRVWINEVPILTGTAIQALVVLDAEHRLHDADGRELAAVHPLLMLTNAEARAFALDGPQTVLGLDPALLLDVERQDLVGTATVPDVPCMVTRLMREDRPRWVEVDEQGRFLAFTQAEPEGYLDDPDNLEVWSLRSLVEHEPTLREFACSASPGDYACWRDGTWETGRIADLD